MVRSTDRPAMTIAVDLGRKATKQTNKQTKVVDVGITNTFVLFQIVLAISCLKRKRFHV